MAQKNVKEDLLRVASDEFYKKGFDAASVKTIVELCGTTAPALYHHFGSKEGLALAYLESAAMQIAERFRTAFARDTLPEIIEAWIEIIETDTRRVDFYGCNIGNFSSQLNLSADRGETHLRLQAKVGEILNAWIDGLAMRLTGLQADGRLPASADPRTLATQLMATYEGGLLLWRATGRDDVIDSVATQSRMTGDAALKA